MTAMRLLCYFHPSQDPFHLRAALQSEGWQRVAMRDGSLWRDSSRPESGWEHVAAPLYPGIARVYEASGAQIVGQAASLKLADPPTEVAVLPLAQAYAILNPGAHLLAEVEAIPLPQHAQVIGVNEAARRIACHWQLCNDGFASGNVQGAVGIGGDLGRITRRRFAATIPTGRWFALDSIGIEDGRYSTTCALCAAASAAPEVVYLYGHDLVEGNGLDGMTGHWDGSMVGTAGAEVANQIAAMRAAGIRVVHVRMVDGNPIADDGAPAKAVADHPAEPAKTEGQKPRRGRKAR